MSTEKTKVIQVIGNLKGDKGDKGDRGEKGDKGNPFTFDDFTEEQLASLKGEPGNDYVLTKADKTEIAQEATTLVDTSLLSIIGTGEVTE